MVTICFRKGNALFLQEMIFEVIRCGGNSFKKELCENCIVHGGVCWAPHIQSFHIARLPVCKTLWFCFTVSI